MTQQRAVVTWPCYLGWGALGLKYRHTSPIFRPGGDFIFCVTFHYIEPKLNFLKIAYCNKVVETKALAYAMGWPVVINDLFVVHHQAVA